ncbi:MAG: hypothetical protein K0B01_07395 [Syntrophobacterales bacterium]|nr:hypothetical protein [Syntrophobacterales bacterium]
MDKNKEPPSSAIELFEKNGLDKEAHHSSSYANPAGKAARKKKQMSQLQNYLSFPKAELNVHNASIGNTVFQAVRTRL